MIAKSVLLSVLLLASAFNVLRAQTIWREAATPTPVGLLTEEYGFACSPEGDLYYVAGAAARDTLYRSSDQGSTWGAVLYGELDKLQCDSIGTVFIMDTVLKFSVDHGVTWSALNVPDASRSDFSLTLSSSQIYCWHRASDILYSSVNFGATWEALDLGSSLNDAITQCYAGSDDRLLVTAGPNSVSLHNGIVDRDANALGEVTWVLFDRDNYVYALQRTPSRQTLIRLQPKSFVWARYVDSVTLNTHVPDASPRVHELMSVTGDGTYVSRDHGDTWTRLGDGVSMNSNSAIPYFTSAGRGYLVARGKLYVSDNFAYVSHEPTNRVITFYPNPVRSHLRFESGGPLRVEVTDALGKTRVASNLRDDSHELDIHEMPSGAYHVRVQTSTGISEGSFVKY